MLYSQYEPGLPVSVCLNEVDAALRSTFNAACAPARLMFCSHCRDISTYVLAEGVRPRRQLLPLRPLPAACVKCYTWLSGGYCNGMARAGAASTAAVLRLTTARSVRISRSVIRWTLIGARRIDQEKVAAMTAHLPPSGVPWGPPRPLPEHQPICRRCAADSAPLPTCACATCSKSIVAPHQLQLLCESTDAGQRSCRVNEGKTAADPSVRLIWHLGSRGFDAAAVADARLEPYVMWRRSPHRQHQPVMLMTWVAAHGSPSMNLPTGMLFAGVLPGSSICARPASRSLVLDLRSRESGPVCSGLQRDVQSRRRCRPAAERFAKPAAGSQAARRRDLPGGSATAICFPTTCFSPAAKPASLASRTMRSFRSGRSGWILDLNRAAAPPALFMTWRWRCCRFALR